jgi:hypothetical protein
MELVALAYFLISLIFSEMIQKGPRNPKQRQNRQTTDPINPPRKICSTKKSGTQIVFNPILNGILPGFLFRINHISC